MESCNRIKDGNGRLILEKVTFILNPSFTDTTFQVKHLRLGHVLDRGLFS